MTPRIVLACSSDAGYAPHAAAMLYSALQSTPEASFVIHYLQDPGFPEAERGRIRQSLACFGARAELHFRTIADDQVAGLPLFAFMKPGMIAPVMWYRVLLPQLLPAEEKVLYLDCDTLVVDSLSPLWETPLGEKALAAVSNPFWEGYNGETPWHAVCGLERAEDYFNSGVMLINLDYFRRHDLSARIVAHGQANASWVRFGDQDSLVSLLHGERLRLHPRYNLMRILVMTRTARRMFGEDTISAAITKPAILHFEGTTKPWVNPTQHPFGRLYTRIARRLPWPVLEMPWGLIDLENFLTRRDWTLAQRAVRRVRHRLERRRSAR